MKFSNCLLSALLILSSAVNVSAQFPKFTRIDSGVLYESPGTAVNSTHMLFDVDNDGDYDPILCNTSATNFPRYALKIYRNEGEGIYFQDQLISDAKNFARVDLQSTMGDVDNDGDVDFIAQRYGTRNLALFLNDGYGSFTLDSIYPRAGAVSSFKVSVFPVVIDFDKDGFLDFISCDSVIVAYYNNGKGKFTRQDTIGSFNRMVRDDWLHAMDIGDVDNDGDMDLYCGLSLGVEKNAMFINTGTSFEQVNENHITLSDTALTTSVNWVDYDNDGDMDLFTTNESLGNKGVLPALYENLGQLEFRKHIILDEKYRGSFTISDYWGDLDNDGDQDLFFSLEDGPFPFPGSYQGSYSTTENTILYKNEGDGTFTPEENTTLTSGEAHTAILFDQENDGDLDVLTVGNAYDRLGHNSLFVNEGNSNSFLEIICTDRYGCATPYGTRISAKTQINGAWVKQTRELSPFNGNASCIVSPFHFGLGDAEIVDSILIRWPSGWIDTLMDVQSNQFYRAIEDSILEINFKATNAIQLYSDFDEILFTEAGMSVDIDLMDHYRFITGDTIPPIVGDSLNFELYFSEKEEVVSASLNESILTLEAGNVNGRSIIQLLVSNSFTQRMDLFKVKLDDKTGIHPMPESDSFVLIYPNPINDELTIRANGPITGIIRIQNLMGQVVLVQNVDNVEMQTIDLRSLQEGVYVLTIFDHKNRTHREIVCKK